MFQKTLPWQATRNLAIACDNSDREEIINNGEGITDKGIALAEEYLLLKTPAEKLISAGVLDNQSNQLSLTLNGDDDGGGGGAQNEILLNCFSPSLSSWTSLSFCLTSLNSCLALNCKPRMSY